MANISSNRESRLTPEEIDALVKAVAKSPPREQAELVGEAMRSMVRPDAARTVARPSMKQELDELRREVDRLQYHCDATAQRLATIEEENARLSEELDALKSQQSTSPTQFGRVKRGGL